MKTVDTNYLVRLFTNRPEETARKVIYELEQSNPGEVLLPDFVVSELMYVLEFHAELAYSRADIIEGVRLILAHPAWRVDHELHQRSLEIYESAGLDYVDCLTLAAYRLERVDTVLTFDKTILKQLRRS